MAAIVADVKDIASVILSRWIRLRVISFRLRSGSLPESNETRISFCLVVGGRMEGGRRGEEGGRGPLSSVHGSLATREIFTLMLLLQRW